MCAHVRPCSYDQQMAHWLMTSVSHPPPASLYMLTSDLGGSTQGHILPKMHPCICPSHRVLRVTSITLNRQKFSKLQHYSLCRSAGHHQSAGLLRIMLLSQTLNTFWVGTGSLESTAFFFAEKPVKWFKEKIHFLKAKDMTFSE